MKLSSLKICGFRGYRDEVHLEFGDAFTVIDGRNGVGKSTIFDAVEFGITGTISKYGDAKAAGQTIADYIWWKGEGTSPVERFVEIVFRDGTGEFRIRRGQFEDPDQGTLKELTERLCDIHLSPQSPLAQLSATSIIRDEHIARLSLDLKEADRYAVLRTALGAIDAETWIERAGRLVTISKHRVEAAQRDVSAVNADIAAASRQIDEIRGALVEQHSIVDGIQRLQAFTASTATGSDLAVLARHRLSLESERIRGLRSLLERFDEIASRRPELARRDDELKAAEQKVTDAQEALLSPYPGTLPSSSLSVEVKRMVQLLSLGREIGLRDGKCPLCSSAQSPEHFHEGLAEVEAIAKRLDEAAVAAARREQDQALRNKTLAEAQAAAATSEQAFLDLLADIELFDNDCVALGLTPAPIKDAIEAALEEASREVAGSQTDLRSLEALRLNSDLYRAERKLNELQIRLGRCQERFGKARKVEAKSHALHDAARRAAAETLDQRLERVLPLMSELYQRLNPHPVWRDMEYSIRGDVKRFLKLKIGDDLNPQFLFSSGQRRATGLAFLLSINIAMAWSKWRSILLDDPVQHIDDFRTIQLAEVMAQLVAADHQIICAVEDAALADLLCRRLPVKKGMDGRRITLGISASGSVQKTADRWLSPLIVDALQAAS